MLFGHELQGATTQKGSLKVGAGGSPAVSYLVFPGQKGIKSLYARFDAVESFESINTSTFLLVLTLGKGAKATDVHNVVIRLLDGTLKGILLNTGANALNPSREGLQTIAFDGTGHLTEAGRFEEFVVEYDLASGSIGTFEWSVPSDLSAMQSVGLLTAQRIIPTLVGNGKDAYAVVYGTPSGFPARFANITVLPDGQSVGLQAGPAIDPKDFFFLAYELQISTDLANWKLFAEIDGAEMGKVKEAFPLLPEYRARAFFRLKEVPPRRLRVAIDATSPAYQEASGGTEVTALVLKYATPLETVTLQELQLRLSTNSATLFCEYSVWSESEKVGAGFIFPAIDGPTTCLLKDPRVQAGVGGTLTVKLNLPQPGVGAIARSQDYIQLEHVKTTGLGYITGERVTATTPLSSAGIRIR